MRPVARETRFIGSVPAAGPALLATLALVLLLALAPFRPATAQTSPGAAVITSITLTKSRTGEDHVLLGFNQTLPQFSIVTNDIDRPILGLSDTVRGVGVVVPPGDHGLIKTVEFNQRDAVLTVVLVGAAGPIHVTATAVGGRAIDLAIKPAPQAARSAAILGAPPPPHLESAPGARALEVVRLKYADVSEVVGLLSPGQSIKSNDNFVPEAPAFGSSGFTGNGQQGGNLGNQAYNQANQDAASSTLGQMVDASVGVDRRLNAVILRGTPEQVGDMKATIAALDVPVQSVLLETIFVELTETAAKDLGLDLNNANGQLGLVTFNSGELVAGGQSAPSRGFARGIGSYSLQAAIHAAVKRGQGRILSKPRISAQSGSSAKIITGDALPILTSIALSGVNAVSQQVQYVNVGVTLQIAPRVSADGYVTSHIFAEVSSVTGVSQGYPTISQREASTSATVRDGDYFIIGGLTQENVLTTKQTVAGLGALPLVGDLFKLHQETGEKTDLYIVVTPHIVTPADSARAQAEAVR